MKDKKEIAARKEAALEIEDRMLVNFSNQVGGSGKASLERAATLANSLDLLMPLAKGNESLMATLALLDAIKPENELESLLAAQMGATHLLAMNAAVCADKSERMSQVNQYTNNAVKLQRLYLEQLNALQKLRGKGQQKIIVEKINVHSGGQAAVGIYEGGGDE